MANVVVVGSQWGDEGKGKIVDWLSERADIVVRFQGGHNAGHTLVVDGTTYKLSLLPSGVVRKGKLSVIGNGVVVDPWALAEEIAKIEKLGVEISRDNLRIAENATLILPLHRELDSLREAQAGDGKIGTTKRGIGPAYEDKVGRRAIRVMDLQDLPSAQAEDRAHPRPPQSASPRPRRARDLRRRTVRASSRRSRRKCFPYVDTVWALLDRERRARQAHPVRRRARRAARHRSRHLSVRHLVQHRGGAGRDRLRPRAGRDQLRARHHQGLHHAGGRGAVPHRAQGRDRAGCSASAAHEFGTVTGRPRRCGWFDACLVRQTRKVGGINGIALTKLDVLDQLPELKICVGYRLDGREIDYLPAAQGAQARVEPIYETMEGWTQSTRGARSWAELPAQCIKYVRRLEELIEAPVALLSTSPKREDTILVHDPFVD